MGTSHSLVDQRRETWVLAAHRMSRERAIIVITSPSRSPSTSLAAQGAFPGLASPTSTASEPSRRPNCGDQRDAEKGAKAKLSLSLREKEKESISPLLSLDLLLNLLVLSLSLSLSLRPTGIPKFYRWLSERYPLVNQPVLGTHVPEVDNLYLVREREGTEGQGERERRAVPPPFFPSLTPPLNLSHFYFSSLHRT